ncbi:DnaA regulatory inactivator Hda [bacterium]|nr:DnaA regulatory inactivator Hda [bacterium]
MSSEINQQFPLALKLDSRATFASFWSDADRELIAALQSLATPEASSEARHEARHEDQPAAGWLYITGGKGCGISHLLQACVTLATKHQLSAMYLSLNELLTASNTEDAGAAAMAGYFDGLEDFDLLCIDDIECLVGQPFWQEQLFYLIEKLKNRSDARLVLGSHSLAAELDIDLADLKSRLKWATGFQLSVLSDEQKTQVLQFKAERLGLVMSAEVASFLMNRCSRNMADLSELLARLDQQALSSGRRLTIPWLKTVLDC